MIVFYAAHLRAQCVANKEVFVTYEKTVNIIFPYAIGSEEHGSGGIIVRQVPGAPQILQVKANRKDFAPTSLSVVTKDGSLYSFVIVYASDVAQLNHIVDTCESVVNACIQPNEKSLQDEEASVRHAKANVRRRAWDDFSTLRLNGLFISKHAVWLRTKFINATAVPYPIDMVKFFLRSKKQLKNAATQEREVRPVYNIYPDTMGGKKCIDIFCAFEPFVVNRRQQLVMQIAECNGNRFIHMNIMPRHFRRMKALH